MEYYILRQVGRTELPQKGFWTYDPQQKQLYFYDFDMKRIRAESTMVALEALGLSVSDIAYASTIIDEGF